MKQFTTRLVTLLLALAMLCSVASAESIVKDPSTANIDWRQFEGSQIRVLLVEHFAANAILDHVEEFEALTGIDVIYETIPEGDYQNKLLIEHSGGGTPPEVYMENYSTVAAHMPGGWVSDMNTYLNNEKLTDPDFYRFDDFMKSAIDYCNYEGILPGIPITGEWQILYYRTDLLEEKGLSVPKTMDELYEVALALNDPENNINGFASRFKKNVGTWSIFGSYLWCYGGQYLDEATRTPCLNTQAAYDAAEFYTRILRDTAPEGVVNYGWSECIAEMQAGTVAMICDSSGFMGQVVDPELSTVADKIGFAAIPQVEGITGGTHVNHWMLGLSAMSPNPDAGWLFIQWATSPEMTKKTGLVTGNSARESMWADEEFRAAFAYEGYIDAALQSSTISIPEINPQIPESQELSVIVENALHEIYGGADVKATMDNAQQLAVELMERGL